jgi:hypothetical protein
MDTMLRQVLKSNSLWNMLKKYYNPCRIGKQNNLFIYSLHINGNKFLECLDIIIGKHVEIDGWKNVIIKQVGLNKKTKL